MHLLYICVCVCVCTLDHITFKHWNPRRSFVVTDRSHIHKRKIIDLCVTQNSDWLEEGILPLGFQMGGSETIRTKLSRNVMIVPGGGSISTNVSTERYLVVVVVIDE
jgi:hypothetical protein